LILEVVSNNEARTVLANGKPFGQVVRGMEKYALLQYGYGLSTPGGIYGFAHRILLTNTLRNPAYLAATDEGVPGRIRLRRH
jgi:hypothetical protein